MFTFRDPFRLELSSRHSQLSESMYLQKPVDCDDVGDVVGRQTDRRQDEDHSHESGTRHAGCSYTSQCRRQTAHSNAVDNYQSPAMPARGHVQGRLEKAKISKPVALYSNKLLYRRVVTVYGMTVAQMRRDSLGTGTIFHEGNHIKQKMFLSLDWVLAQIRNAITGVDNDARGHTLDRLL